MINFKRKFHNTVVALGLATFAMNAHAVKVGTDAPDFALKDAKNVEHKLSAHKGKFVVLEWLNHNCPFVVKHYDSGNMQALQKEFTAKGVVWYSINSTSPTNKKDYLDAAGTLKAQTKHKSVATAVLMDPEGTVGKSYDAKVTPHMYIVSPEGKVVYNGAIDDKATTEQADLATSTPLFKNALTAAMTAVETKKPISVVSNKPYGCSVKYQ